MTYERPVFSLDANHSGLFTPVPSSIWLLSSLPQKVRKFVRAPSTMRAQKKKALRMLCSMLRMFACCGALP